MSTREASQPLPLPTAGGDTNEPDWVAGNAQHRRQALECLSRRKLHTELVVARLVVEPLRSLKESQVAIESDAWEDDQLARKATAIQAGELGLGARPYRVTMAAERMLEKLLRLANNL